MLLDKKSAPRKLGQLSVLAEDDTLLILDKPTGMCTNYRPEFEGPTLEREVQLLHERGEQYRYAHRLDANTSGVLAGVFGAENFNKMRQQWHDKTVTKFYFACVDGVLMPGTYLDIQEPLLHFEDSRRTICNNDGKPARTEVVALQTNRSHSLTACLCRIHTGRTHQIRVHLANHGYPVHDDAKYNCKEGSGYYKLHAAALGFKHPRTEQKLFYQSAPRWKGECAQFTFKTYFKYLQEETCETSLEELADRITFES